MLGYDDPIWKELKGGYKVLYNPTVALQKLENGTSMSEAWDELWQELYHQGDVGEASYASVPQLVRIHREKQNLGWNIYSLVSEIEIERHRKTNPNIPIWLELSYRKAWTEILDLGLSDLREANDEITTRAILGALALSKGLIKFGALISTFDESEIDEFLNESMAWSDLYR
jgi:hypothetical protein